MPSRYAQSLNHRTGVDNLPGEVCHLLQEIRHRESRAVELQQEIDKDCAKYIRRRSHGASLVSTTPPSPASRPPSPKSVSIPAKISTSYAEIQELAGEKCALAQQLIELLSKTRARLDIDIVKVRMLQGENPEIPTVASRSSRPPVATSTLENFGAMTRNPALAISESLRNALALTPAADPRPLVQVAAAASSGPATKKRRLNVTNSIKITPAVTPIKHRSASPSTIAVTTTQVIQQKSRLSRQIHLPVEDLDVDADGDEDAEEEIEDETLYCICQKQSYGDMIACDNEDGCPYEWFHLACVGLKIPTPEKWFCSACSKDKGIPTTITRKGRRK